MPSEGSEEVAADHSATEATPVGGSEAAGEAEGVEENPPLTVDPVAEDSRNWADCLRYWRSRPRLLIR